MTLGSDAHHALIEQVVAHYRQDGRVLAIAVFGSVSTGTWHEFSDVDLDVVTADGVDVMPGREAGALFGPRAAIVVAGADCADVVLGSLETRCGLSLAQRLERRPDLGREQLGLFPGGEVAAPVDLVEVDEGGVRLLDPAARARKISPGNVVKPTGSLTSARGCPAAWAAACAFSQYDRAAEAPVPVSQYSVMLSTILSRVRWPAGGRHPGAER